MNELHSGTTNLKFYRALEWIVTLFTSNSIDYLLVGGAAAYFYGSKRLIHDIDFYADLKDLEKINDLLNEYITQKPMYYKDEYWDITFMKLFYQDQQIEIGDIHNCFIYDKKKNIWVKQLIDLQNFTEIKSGNITVKVMNKEQLIAYKNILGRKVDIIDIQNINN